jgi:hypothetical protein
MPTTNTFKLGLRNQKPHKKLEICQQLMNGLGKLTPEEREAIWWPDLQEKCADAEQALKDIALLRAELRAAFSRRTKTQREMCRAAERSANGLAVRVSYDPVQGTAGGLTLRRPKQPVGQAAAPGQLRALRGSHEGSVVLRWKRPVRRCVFLVEMTTDPNGLTGWVRVKECLPAKCELKGLPLGVLHWFRVAALNAHGQGPWSAVATLRPG